VRLFAVLAFLITLTTLLELAILLELGRRVGVLATLALVIVTAVLGGWLMKTEGLGVLRRTQEQLAQGLLPADELLHGVLILAGGLLLLTPGLLTDTTGLLLLFPPTRRLVAEWLKRKLRRMIEQGTVVTYYRL
jgi:UPF0716 protein FxsA